MTLAQARLCPGHGMSLNESDSSKNHFLFLFPCFVSRDLCISNIRYLGSIPNVFASHMTVLVNVSLPVPVCSEAILAEVQNSGPVRHREELLFLYGSTCSARCHRYPTISFGPILCKEEKYCWSTFPLAGKGGEVQQLDESYRNPKEGKPKITLFKNVVQCISALGYPLH